MKLTVSRTFTDQAIMEVTIDEADMDKALLQATFFLQPDYCTLCKNTIIRWEGRKANTDAGEFIYISRVCRKCGAKSTAGKFKGGGYFWKQWEIYEGKHKKSPVAEAQTESKKSLDDIPVDLPWES